MNYIFQLFPKLIKINLRKFRIRFIFALILGISLMFSPDIPNSLFASKELGLYIVSAILCVDLLVRTWSLKYFRLKFNLIDIFVFNYLILLPFIQLFIIHGVRIESLIGGIASFLIYIWCRIIKALEGSINIILSLFYATALILILNIIVAFLQVIGVMETFNSVRSISGFYFNPAPFSTLITSFLIFTVFFLEKFKVGIKSVISYSLIILSSLFILIKLDSRTSILSLIIVFIAFFLIYFRKIIKYIFYRYRIYRFLLPIILISILMVLTITFYNIRPESVKGRMLIWKSAILLIEDNFWSGVGVDRFKAKYAYYQGEFLSKNSSNLITYGNFADETHYAFNEYLQIASERGIFGLFFYLAIISICFWKCLLMIYNTNNRSPINMVFFYVLLFLILSSLTSYSTQLLPISLYFWLIIAFINVNMDNTVWFHFKRNTSERLFHMASVLLLFCVFFFGMHFSNRYESYLVWQNFIVDRKKKDNLISIYDNLKDNPDLNKHVGDLFFKQRKYEIAVKYYKNAVELTYDVEFYYALGRCYEELNYYCKAEKEYLKISESIPKLLKPHYLLAKLYFRIGDVKKFNIKAREIQNFKSKIPNGEVYFMKEEIKLLQANIQK